MPSTPDTHHSHILVPRADRNPLGGRGLCRESGVRGRLHQVTTHSVPGTGVGHLLQQVEKYNQSVAVSASRLMLRVRLERAAGNMSLIY